MPLGSVLIHVGIPVRETPTADEEGEVVYVEGEPSETKPKEGTPFDCFLIYNRGGAEQNVPKGKRVLEGPVILYEPFDVTGADFRLDAEDQVKITAPEILGPDPVLFQVDGDPTPMAKPGFLVGSEAVLKRVKD